MTDNKIKVQHRWLHSLTTCGDCCLHVLGICCCCCCILCSSATSPTDEERGMTSAADDDSGITLTDRLSAEVPRGPRSDKEVILQ